ncbi:MAG: FtsX-like permease family protein [Akkermansiaceae bacterium]|nr:FtsX-like permease family protein [Akkermansiaceae bacterium]
MKSFSWTLALRYLNPLRTFVSIITLISLVGVALGVMVLIVVLSVHNGFERNLKDTLLGFSPHISVYSNTGDGRIYDWAEMEETLAKEPRVVSAYALVEGFVLLDSKSWQKPVYFRAINVDNDDQLEALGELLDPDYPTSKIDFNFEGDKNAVISKQLAEGLGLEPGEEIRVIAASNLDAVMAVYNVPGERAWDLYPDVFESFQSEVKRLIEKIDGAEKARSVEILKAYRSLEALVPVEVQTPTGGMMTEGKEMRPVERTKIYEIMDLLAEVDREEGGFDFFAKGRQEEVLMKLKEMRELDLEKADNEGFRQIEEFVVPQTLLIQGVYADSKRSQGPGFFIPLTIGMELKDLQGGVESIGLRIEDPYHAEETARALQANLGEEWIVQSWMVTHASQFQLVKTEKLMISFTLSFITILSAFSIMAVMYTVTVQKRQEIGVMKALGARPSQIVRVFLYQGIIVGVGGAILGLGLGLLAIEYREVIMKLIRSFGVDPFPAEFHGMSELPARVMPDQLLLICAIAIVLCSLAALIPALVAAFRDPAKSLRNL